MKIQRFVISGFDRAYSQDGLIVCRGDKHLDADTYNLRNAYILVFDKSGKLYEGGANLSSAEGSVQKSVCVPAGGFAVIFGANHPLYDYYLTATEGAVIYNSTISLIYPMWGEYDPDAALFTVNMGNEKVTENTVKYLFVGNSCTYINGNPIKFKALCKQAGIDVSVDYCTYGSAYFTEYADEKHPRGQALRKILENKKYDYIVLQDGYKSDYHKSLRALETLLELVKENGATPLLYMRYAYESDKEQRIIQNGDLFGTYGAMGDLYGVPVSPVAQAFTLCAMKHPEIELYADDEHHHSKEGSYLAACCWLYNFCGVSPVGNVYTAGLDKNVAATLQKIALETCEEKLIDEITQTAKAVVKEKQRKKARRVKTGSLTWALVGAGAGVVVTVAALATAGALRKKLIKRKK